MDGHKTIDTKLNKYSAALLISFPLRLLLISPVNPLAKAAPKPSGLDPFPSCRERSTSMSEDQAKISSMNRKNCVAGLKMTTEVTDQPKSSQRALKKAPKTVALRSHTFSSPETIACALLQASACTFSLYASASVPGPYRQQFSHSRYNITAPLTLLTS